MTKELLGGWLTQAYGTTKIFSNQESEDADSSKLRFFQSILAGYWDYEKNDPSINWKNLQAYTTSTEFKISTAILS